MQSFIYLREMRTQGHGRQRRVWEEKGGREATKTTTAALSVRVHKRQEIAEGEMIILSRIMALSKLIYFVLFCIPGFRKTGDAIHTLSDSKRLGDNLHASSSV